MSRLLLFVLLTAFLAVPAGSTQAPNELLSDRSWPMFGGTPARNMANLRERLGRFPQVGPSGNNDEKWENEWVLWKAELGGLRNIRSGNHSSPVVAGGRVYIGTGSARPRNKRDFDKDGEPLDKGVLMCFDEETGKFLWQAVHDKLPNQVNDWAGLGVNSTPAVVGDRVYYVSNECRVVCLDANGFANGNQGIQTEKYKDDTDADVIWEYDMMRELKVFPHRCSNCSPLVVGDRIFVCTSNGVDETYVKLPSPDAPSLICLDRNTGKLLWSDNSPGKNVMQAQWSSPSFVADPVPQVIHGQGDGWLRGFDPATGKLLWQFDGNAKDAKWDHNGLGTKSYFIGMPVVHDGRVYIGTGQDPQLSSGIANLWCVDLKKAVELGAKAPNRDVSPELVVRVEKQNGEDKVVTKPNPASALVWVYGGEESRQWAPHDFKFGRTLGSVAVVDDVVYAAELHGYIHCLNANTGEEYWRYDTRASVWGSPFYVDGRMLLGTSGCDLFAFRHDARPKKFDAVEAAKGAPNAKAARAIHKATHAEVEKEYLLAKLEFPDRIMATPTVVNGVLYVATEKTLYAMRTR